ncbi:hypothetical protein [Rhizobium phage RHph_X2_24]|nr:hypothetical protein [Rhizobium phage RHph_X2_24]
MRENSVAQRVQLEAARLNILTMRNNVGVAIAADGRHVRYGLMNESKKQNDYIKSSDYIAITPVQCYVPGIEWTTLGVFTAIETKASDWKFSQSDERAVAQLRFHDMVRQYGGFAGFATGPEDVARIIRRQI